MVGREGGEEAKSVLPSQLVLGKHHGRGGPHEWESAHEQKAGSETAENIQGKTTQHSR